MEKFIPLSVPNLQGNEKKYVLQAVETEWVSTGGSFINDLEGKIASYVHTPGAVACQSGTAGLHLSLLLCGVGRDDAVLVPTLTFIAAVNPVMYVGAAPIFMDCDDSLCMDPDKVESFCREECRLEGDRLIEKLSGRHVKAMVVVHVFGNMADMERLLEIAARYHVQVIEDATEAIGTFYTKGPYIGQFAGTMGRIGALSFNGNKIVTTGGGGMVVSMDEGILKHAKHLSTQAKSDELYYEHDEIGYNYRMTNLQAAVGLGQMEQLDAFIATKKRNYNAYKAGMAEIPGMRLLDFRPGTDSNHWFYALYCEDGAKRSRDELIQHLQQNRIQSRPIWGLIHEQIPYRGARAYRIDRAIDYRSHVVNLPCSTNLAGEDVQRVLDCLKK